MTETKVLTDDELAKLEQMYLIDGTAAAVRLRQVIDSHRALLDKLKWAEFYGDRARKAAARPCMKCGYEPAKVTVQQS
jgi:hypothetical protein